jgi:hypothetical protein
MALRAYRPVHALKRPLTALLPLITVAGLGGFGWALAGNPSRAQTTGAGQTAGTVQVTEGTVMVTAGAKGAQMYCFMRASGNSHQVSWDAAYALIKRQSDSVFKTSPEHASVMIAEAVVQNPGKFPDCGRYLGDLFVKPEPKPETKSETPAPTTAAGSRYNR